MALVEVARPFPTSWDDLDWDDPDVGDTRYLQSLMLALAERCQTSYAKNYLGVLKDAWCATPSGTAVGKYSAGLDPRNTLRCIREALWNIAPCFIIPWDKGNYKPDISDFPKRWSSYSLFRAIGGVPISPIQGTPLIESKEVLKRLKEALSLLYLAPVKEARGHSQYSQNNCYDAWWEETSSRDCFDAILSEAGERPWGRGWTLGSVSYEFSSYTTSSVYGSKDPDEERVHSYSSMFTDEARKVICAYGGETLRPEICVRLCALRPENPYPEANISSVAYDGGDTGLREGEIVERRFPYGTRDIVLHAPFGGIVFAGEPVKDVWVKDGDYEHLPESYATRGFTARACVYLDFSSVFRFK